MSQTLLLHIPDPLLQRLHRLAQAANRPLEELVVSTLDESVPRPPAGLPEEIRDELAQLEQLSDQELEAVAQETMAPEEVPVSYQPGDVGDRLALRKAYALVLWKWRGHSLDELKGFAA